MGTNISEAQYDKLCDACDLLLKKNIISFERNANAFLNVIREHPVFLNGYRALFHKSDMVFFIDSIKLLFWYLIIGSVKLFHSIWRYYFLRDRVIKDERFFDNVFVSHFLNHSFIEHESDFYFFDLPQEIENKNQSSLQLYINFTSKSSSKIQERWKNRPIASIALPRYLSIFQEIKIRGLLFREAILILKSKSTSKFEKRVKFQAAIASLSSATHSNYRLAVILQKYIKKNSVKRIFTTYEGHPWERLIFGMAREINPSIQCVGYQHALIFRKQHAIRRKLSKNFEPNFILFSGEHGRQQFKNIDYLPSNRLLCFGTNRSIETKRDQLAVNKKARNLFLMLSEGDLVECIPLARFIIQLSKKYHHAHFIIRFHPITRVKSVLKAIPELINPPVNIELSRLSFEEDLKRAHFAIYRGSTSIIKAIQYGLIPLYYEKVNEISIDPLIDIQKEKINLKSPDDIRILYKIPHQDLILRQKKLIAFVTQFFSPVNYQEALKVLD